MVKNAMNCNENTICHTLTLLSDPRLKRGFSNIIENETLVNAARTSVLQDIKEDNHHQMFATFVLPDLTIYPEEFRAFLKKELIESSTLHSLQQAGVYWEEGMDLKEIEILLLVCFMFWLKLLFSYSSYWQVLLSGLCPLELSPESQSVIPTLHLPSNLLKRRIFSCPSSFLFLTL